MQPLPGALCVLTVRVQGVHLLLYLHFIRGARVLWQETHRAFFLLGEQIVCGLAGRGRTCRGDLKLRRGLHGWRLGENLLDGLVEGPVRRLARFAGCGFESPAGVQRAHKKLGLFFNQSC